MSTELLNIPYGNMINEKQARYYFNNLSDERDRHKNIMSSKSCWFNPSYHDLVDERTNKRVKARTIYVGEESEGNTPIPTWNMPVLNVDKLEESNQVRVKGTYASMTEVDKAQYNPYHEEFHETLKYYHDYLVSTASMTSQDFSLINNATLTGVLINNTQRQYAIQNACTVENTTDITFREYAVDRFQIDGNVGEMSRVEPKKMGFTKQDFLMRKIQAELQWSDEFLMQNYLFDPLALARANMSSDAERVKATMILLLLNSFHDTGGNDLTAFETNVNRSSYNPIRAVNTIKMNLEKSHFGQLNTGVMNPITSGDWLINTFTQNFAAQSTITTDPGTISLPGINGVSVYVDPLVPIGVLHLYDKGYVIRKQGPVRTESYRIPQIGANGLIYRDYCTAYIRDSAYGETLTTLSPA